MSDNMHEERLNEVKSLLVSQPKPADPKSPYYILAKKYGIKVDFRPFIQVDPISPKEFRKQKVISWHSAIIFTSRNAVDHFFTICKGLKIDAPLT